MEILGYIAAALIGLSLGLIGGGGSILTVPVLVYMFGQSATDATAHSLFIVGLTAFVGSLTYFRRQEVDLRTAWVFGLPSIAAVYAVRAFVVPAIPETLLKVGETVVTRDMGILFLFAGLMVLTSVSMIRPTPDRPAAPEETEPQYQYVKILLEGILVGSVTGLVGAGGGFLIIPALVLLTGIPMKRAVGTSLIIIAAKSLVGFLGDIQRHATIDWRLLGTVGIIAIAGILAGSALATRIPGKKLKPAFGYFVLVMGVSMIAGEVAKSRNMPPAPRASIQRHQGALEPKPLHAGAATLSPQH